MSEDELAFVWGALTVGWLASVTLASVFYRRKAGKPIRPSPPSITDFVETGCSGRSLKNLTTKLGGASNCLLVYIANKEFVVTPTFPFTLLFLPETYGLEIRVPLSAITSIDGPVGRKIRLSFTGGVPAPLELRLQHPNKFVEVLGLGVGR